MQENINAILKQQLRDVHMPTEIGWWPLALGWWLLALLLLLILGGLSVYLSKHYAQNRYRKIALNELKASYDHWLQAQKNTACTIIKHSSSTYLKTANTLLRRCVMKQQHDSHLVSATGERWLNTLNQMSDIKLSLAAQTAIANQCYQAAPDVDIHALHAELSTWIKAHKPPNLTTIALSKKTTRKTKATQNRSTHHA